MAAVEGATEIATNAALPTVSVAELDIDPIVAEIVADPCAALVAIPLLPLALLITATLLDEEAQVAVEVTSCVLPSV